MLPARIAELLQPFLEPVNDQQLTSDDLNHISTYIDILLRWNTRINLTAIRDPEDIVTRHFGESLFAARHLFPTNGTNGQRRSEPGGGTKNRSTLADLGAGAGFPGIPIKLWAPPISLTLIESNHKKATFLREITRALTLTNVNIQTARAESITNASFDVVTLRAVERFESVLPAAAGLVVPGGRLALLIGSTQQSAARHGLPDLSWSGPIPIPLSQSRVLLFAHK
jgi:16S rRNA (guanine527-N7)-methyltransferase